MNRPFCFPPRPGSVKARGVVVVAPLALGSASASEPAKGANVMIVSRTFPVMVRACGSAVLAAVLAVGAIFGQEQARVSGEPEWPIDPTSYPRPTHPATRACGPIVIDGRPDEAVWEEAPPITRFIQSRPDMGYPATQHTIVRVLYDDEAFYLSGILYDEPGNITVTSLERDFPPLDSDVLSFVLDTNLDRRNSFLFLINPYGAVGDAQAFDDMRILNNAWDGVVQVETQLTDFGWTMEIAIPWSTLRFEGAEGSQDWGFNVQRRIRRINESSTWSPLERREFQPKVSRAGTLTGFVGLEQGRNLWLEPYVRGSVALGSEGVAGGDEVDAGLDLKYGVTSSLTLDATYRTDFSHVEVDELQVNLTRFPLFFPERRNFFIENSGMFEFDDGTPREFRLSVSGRDFTLFHTRRVGLSSGGELIPIAGGARLTGSLGQFEVGALAMRTDEAAGRASENFAVFRLRRRMLGASNVGFMVTHRDLVGEEGQPVDNRAFGIDANFTLADHLLLTSYVAAAEGSELEGDLKNRLALRLSAGWRDSFWDTSVLYRRLGPGFDPGLGFVRRRGINHYYATFGVHPPVEGLALQEINPYVTIDYFTNLESVLETRSVGGGLGFTFDDGSRSTLKYEHLFERLFEPFGVSRSELSVGVGDYQTQAVAFSHRTSPARILSANVSVSHGGYFDGTQTSYGGGGVWHPIPHLALEATLTRSEISLPDGDFVADLAGLKVSLNPTTALQRNAFVQYNGLTDEVVSNLRVRFIHAPLSDLYLVYSERRAVDGDVDPERSIAVKVTRLLAF